MCPSQKYQCDIWWALFGTAIGWFLWSSATQKDCKKQNKGAKKLIWGTREPSWPIHVTKNIYKSHSQKKKFCVHWYCVKSVLKYDKILWQELQIHLMLATWRCVATFEEFSTHSPHSDINSNQNRHRDIIIREVIFLHRVWHISFTPSMWNLWFPRMLETPLHRLW